MKNYGFYSSVYLDKYIYWLTRDKGIFVRKNLETNHIEFIQISKEINMEYSTVLCVDNRIIYGVLNSGKTFFAYNTEDSSVSTFEINKQQYSLDLITYTGLCDGKIVIIGRYSKNIIYIDKENGEVEEMALLEEKDSINNHRIFSRGFIKQGNDVYVFNHENSQVIKIDICKKEVERIPITNEIGYIEDGISVGDGFFLLNDKDEIYKCDRYFQNQEMFYSYSMERKKQYFSGLIGNEKEMLLLSKYGDVFIRVDLNSGNEIEVIQYPIGTEYKKIDIVGHSPSVTSIGEDKYCIGMYGTNQLFCIDKNNFGEYLFYKVDIEGDSEIEYLRNRGIEYFIEGEYDIKDFIDYIDNVQV